MSPFDTFLNVLKEEIINPLITVVALAAFIFFVWGVVQFIGGAADEERRTTGKRHMVWGIIGLVIIFGAQAIVAFMAGLFGLSVPD
jgi:hypothetical protein